MYASMAIIGEKIERERIEKLFSDKSERELALNIHHIHSSIKFFKIYPWAISFVVPLFLTF